MHWATAMASRIATRAGNYRGMRAVAYWGQTVPPPARRDGLSQDMPDEDARPTRPQRVHHLTRSPTPREAPPDEDDDAMGMWMIQLDDPQEHAEDPKGL